MSAGPDAGELQPMVQVDVEPLHKFEFFTFASG
jgi:hypothetical protein